MGCEPSRFGNREGYAENCGDLASHPIWIYNQIPPRVTERAPTEKLGFILLMAIAPEGLPIDAVKVPVDLNADSNIDISEICTTNELSALVPNLVLCNWLR